MVKHCSVKELLSIIKDFAELGESKIYSDSWKAYDGLVDFLLRYTRNFARRCKGTLPSKAQQKRVCKGTKHINVIENVFASCYALATASRMGFTKFRLAKFRGIKKENFVLHLKETEFRYNTKNLGQNLYQNLLKLIIENPVKFN